MHCYWIISLVVAEYTLYNSQSSHALKTLLIWDFQEIFGVNFRRIFSGYRDHLKARLRNVT